MASRPLFLVFCLACTVLAAGTAMLSRESFAVEVPPGDLPDAIGRPAPAAADPAVAHADLTDGRAGPEAALAPSGAIEPVAADAARTDETVGWTAGVVRGDIQLAVSVLDRLTSITVVIEEQRRPYDHDGSFERPHRLVAAVQRGPGTPTFEVRDVPFSAYPYCVTVHAPGLNGSRRTLVIDRDHALIDDVVLSITPGAPYSILLRDQDARPHTEVDVAMVPNGEPFGRSSFRGTTDNFGSVVFDDVLAGNYDIVCTLSGQPLATETTTVLPGARAYGRKVQGQGRVLTIPRGVELRLQVHDVAGYGVAEAKVTAIATSRVRLTQQEVQTDFAGRAHFPHLQPGTWQITVERENFQRTDVQVTLTDGQLPESRDVRLVRTRW